MLQIIHDNFFLQHNYVTKFCTYLNGHLLGAPREYILHGLNPGLNWSSCCPASWAFFLFVLAHPASWCLLQWLKFLAHPSLLARQLNTDIQVNNTTMPHFGTHVHISTSHSCYYSLHFFHSLGQAGWLRLFPCDTETFALNLTFWLQYRNIWTTLNVFVPI
jgi:hypothetical protein